MTKHLFSKSVGTILVLSGASKAFNVAAFADEARLYADAYIADGLHHLAMPAAVALCAVEVWLGLLSISRSYATFAMWPMLALLSFFVWLTAVNAFWPSPFGPIESCGCFGELIHFTPLASFIKSAVLWLVALAAVVMQPKITADAFKPSRYAIFAMVAGIALPLFSLLALDRMGHGVYLAAFLGLCGTSGFLAWRMHRKQKAVFLSNTKNAN